LQSDIGMVGMDCFMLSQLALDMRLEPGTSFASYFVGANGEAVDAVRALAEGRGEPVLFIYGGRGLGKSHLMQAACRVAADLGDPVAYLPLRDAVQWSPDMLEGLEEMTLVALDDIDAIAASAAWQEAVFHLFNRLRTAGHRLLMTAERRPADVGLTLNDLVSRLQWGLVLRLHDHDDAQKAAGLHFHARLRGLELPEETVRYLLVHCPRELPSLFRLLDRLDRASLMAQRRLTIPFVRQVLQSPA
jgi:DnaA family protein